MRWNNLGNPNLIEVGQVIRDRPAGRRSGDRDGAAGDDGARRDAAAREPSPAAQSRRRRERRRRRPDRHRRANPPPAPAREAARAVGAARRRRRHQLGLAGDDAGVDAVRRRAQQGPGLPRQGRRSGLRRGRWPGRLRRLGPARLRQPGDPQAQHDLPHRLRAQPDPAGQGRPAASSAARRSPRWDRPMPTACSSTSRSASRASRSIRRACCRRARRQREDVDGSGPRLRHRDDPRRRRPAPPARRRCRR